MTDKEKTRRDFLYHTKRIPTYLLFIVLYPFCLEDLVGEIWKDIVGYEGLYQVSNFGRIKSFPRKYTQKEIKILKPVLSKGGYLQCHLIKDGKSKTFAIHRLVAEAFLSNPNNLPEVNHKFGNKFDNYYENLEWCNSSQNKQHAFNMGLMQSGSESTKAKLTTDQVLLIRANYKPHDKEFGMKALAKKFNVNTVTIKRILARKTYKNIY